MLRRFGAPGVVALVGSLLGLAGSFTPPVLGPSWRWVAFGIGVVALVLACRSLYRGITTGWTTVPSLVVIAASICLLLQVWIPQLQLAPFGIAVLVFIGFVFS